DRAGAGNDRRVDADQLAARVHQGAAAVAGVDRRVGLDEVLVVREAEIGPPRRADDAGGDGVPERLGEGVADGEDPLADLEAIGGAPRHGPEGRVMRLDYGGVRR